MNLVIDAGNTLIKAAVFDKNEIIELWKGEKIDQGIIESLVLPYPIDGILVSDVSGGTAPIKFFLEKTGSPIWMNAQTPVPIVIDYKSPDTLGPDRIAAAVYASDAFAGKNTLAIQAGTCITYELTTSSGVYEGGGISPGLDMRLQAMHTFTAKLPLVKKEQINFLYGKSTNESILSGVINGCTAEIDGIIDRYKLIFPDLMVVLGGGDIFFFDKTLKNRIFATANLVLKGLNIILEHNK